MSTDDVTDLESPCKCGAGTIIVTQSMPDHGWVRDSQIEYSAKINCDACEEIYLITSVYNSYPSLVRRSDVELEAAAKCERELKELELKNSAQAKRLIARIADDIDMQPSMAAQHRKITAFGLNVGSLAVYRKNCSGGHGAVEYIPISALCRIGKVKKYGGEDADYFAESAVKIEMLRATENALRPIAIETGATWMSK